MHGQVFLKGGVWHFSYLVFQGLSFSHLEIILLFEKLLYTFEEFFFCQHNFMRKKSF